MRDIPALGDSLCNAGDCTPKTGSGGWKWWRHTRSKDRRNIQYHYDVSNDFYGLWLDTRRVYSCAYFTSPDMSLDAAQEAKLDHICRKLDLKPDELFLDIGWAGAACCCTRRNATACARSASPCRTTSMRTSAS